jgi:hypothetical protein
MFPIPDRQSPAGSTAGRFKKLVLLSSCASKASICSASPDPIRSARRGIGRDLRPADRALRDKRSRSVPSDPWLVVDFGCQLVICEKG